MKCILIVLQNSAFKSKTKSPVENHGCGSDQVHGDQVITESMAAALEEVLRPQVLCLPGPSVDCQNFPSLNLGKQGTLFQLPMYF